MKNIIGLFLIAVGANLVAFGMGLVSDKELQETVLDNLKEICSELQK